MALDDAPSVEVEVKDVGSGGDTPTPSPSESPSESPADTSAGTVDISSTQSAEDTGREADGNKDMNLEVIKANAEPKINNGMVSAAQQAQESHTEQRAERAEKEKEELEAAVDNARETRDGRRRAEDEEKQRKEWETKTHQMGNVEMSGADLDKLLNFMKSPAAIAKVEAAMKAKGASQKQVEKAQKEWKEYQELKDKEKSGEQLTPQEMKRLQEINKSEEFKLISETGAQIARNDGVKFSVENFKQSKDNLANIEYNNAVVRNQEIKSITQTDEATLSRKETGFEDLSSKTLAKAHFASAPALTNDFASSAAMPVAQPMAANDLSTDKATVASIQAKQKAVALDTSFG